jgi:DNA-binding response OmpR family regulator
MYIIVDDRNMVAGGYANGFDREGVSSAGIEASEFREWIGKISDTDMNAVEAFVIGDCNEREALSRLIRERSSAPLLCLNERQSLDDTLGLFAAGADDVLRKPVHVREIVARVRAIGRRVFGERGNVTPGELRVYFDGREPGERKAFSSPRRGGESSVPAALSRSARQQDANLQRRLRALDEDVDEERDRELHQ